MDIGSLTGSIELKNNASDTLKKVSAEVGNLAGQTSQLVKSNEAAAKSFVELSKGANAAGGAYESVRRNGKLTEEQIVKIQAQQIAAAAAAKAHQAAVNQAALGIGILAGVTDKSAESFARLSGQLNAVGGAYEQVRKQGALTQEQIEANIASANAAAATRAQQDKDAARSILGIGAPAEVEATPVTKLADKLGGADTQKQAGELMKALEMIHARGELTAHSLANVAKEAENLQKKGAVLTPELKKLADNSKLLAAGAGGAGGAVTNLNAHLANTATALARVNAAAAGGGGGGGGGGGDDFTRRLAGMTSALTRLTGAGGGAGGAITGFVGRAAGAAAPIAIATAAIVAMGVAFYKLGEQIFDWAQQAADAGDRMNDFATRTGLAVEKVAPLEFALNAVGSSLTKMESSMEKFSQQQAKSGHDSGRFNKALADININAAAFNKMPLNERVWALAEGFQNMTDKGNASKDVIALFGKNSEDLLVTFDKMTPKLREIAQRNAVVWTPELIDHAETFNVSLNILQQTFSSIGVRIGQELLPHVAKFLQKMAESETLIRIVEQASYLMVRAIGYLIIGLGNLILTNSLVALSWVELITITQQSISKLIDYAQVAAGILTIVSPTVGKALSIGLEAADLKMKEMTTSFNEFSTRWAKVGVNVGKELLTLGAGLSTVGLGARAAGAGIDTIRPNPAIAKFNEDVEKLVKSLLGIPENLAEMSAALDIVIAMPNLSMTQIKGFVDQLVKWKELNIPLTQGQKAFLEDFESIGTKAAAATAAIKEYGDAAKATADNLELVGLALKEAQINAKLDKQLFEVGQKLTFNQFTPEEAEQAETLLNEAAQNEYLKAVKDFNQSQLDLIYSYNAEALAAHQDLNLKDLALTHAQLDAQLEAAERGLRMQLALGTMNQETYEKTLMAVQTAHEDRRLAATRSHNLKIAEASVAGYAQLLQTNKDYQRQAELQGRSAADQARIRLKHEYDDRIKALGMVVEKGSELYKRSERDIEHWRATQEAELKLANGAFAKTVEGLERLTSVLNSIPNLSGWAKGAVGALGAVTTSLGQARSQLQPVVEYDETTGQYVQTTQFKQDKLGGGLQAISGAIGGVGAARQGDISGAALGGASAGLGIATMAGMTLAMGAATMGIGAAVMVAYAMIERAQNQTVKDRKEFATSMGMSLHDLNAELMSLGEAGEKVADFGMNVVGEKDDAGNQKWMADVKAFYQDIQEQAAEMGTATGVWSEQQERVAKHLAKSAEGMEQLKEAQAGQAQFAGAGLSRALTISDTALKSYDALTQRQKALNEAIAKEEDPKNLENLRKELDLTNKDLERVTKVWEAVQIHSEGAARGVSGSVLSMVVAQMKAGASFTEAIRGSGPAIKALQDQMAATGYSGGEALQYLTNAAKIVNDELAGPALDAASGYADAMSGLANAGMMDAEMFKGLAEQIGGTAIAIEGQGFSHKEVMAAMQSDLQTIWEMQQKYGYAVDDTTQALIDEGVQSGLIGEQAKSDNQKILDVLIAIGDALGATIPEGLRKMTGASMTAAEEIEANMARAAEQMARDMAEQAEAAGQSLADIANQAPSGIEIPVTYAANYEGQEAQTHAGGGIVYAAGGARVLPFRPRGTDTVPAMLTPGERVLTVDETKRYDANQGGGDMHITLTMPDGEVLLRQIVKSRKRLG